MGARLPGQKLIIVVAKEHLALAQHPTLHFEAQEQQATVVLGHLDGLIEIKGQELVAEEGERDRTIQ